jgi:predicted phage terminase large subunit-like protein
MLTDLDLDVARQNLHRLDADQKARVLELLEERDTLARLTAGRTHFLDFVKAVWPDFIAGAHHTIMAEAFDDIANGQLKRLIINLAPRHTKSEFASFLLPAYFLGRFPKKKIIQVSNTESLAAGFGRKVRNLLAGAETEVNEEGLTPFNELFPGVMLAKDSQAAAEWATSKGGSYFAVGVNGKVTGKGADIAIVDDPHSEQEARQAETNPDIFDNVYEWYTSGIRQRLQPGGAIIIVVTRWSKRDLVGQVLKQQEKAEAEGLKFYDKWRVINLPAILDEGAPTERPMWPGFWSLEELQSTRTALPISKWKAQYQQEPTSEEGAIIKRESWKVWGDENTKCPGPQHAQAWRRGEPPKCDFVISSWDTAQKKTERSDYSAMTTWGVFQAEDPETGKAVSNLILLANYKARLEFPTLKQKVKQFYDEDQPDTLLVEDKGSGISLIQEFRAMGTPVENFSYGRGAKGVSNDKVARANLVSDIFASGYVWRPPLRSAEEVVEECAEFPYGEHDDYVDSVVQALLRFRSGGLIRTARDEEDEDVGAARFRRRRYY